MAKRRSIFSLIFLFFATTPGCKPRDKTDNQPAMAEKRDGISLVLVVVIDQLPIWSFNRDMSHFSGGVRRLLDNGTAYTGEFPYANTYTAPGHTTIGTGAPPAVTGIMANSWFSEEQNRHVSAVDDPRFPVFNPRRQGTFVKGVGVSTHRLLIKGLADALREGSPGSRSVSIGLKERAAALLLGKKADLAVWYEPDIPAMTTSRFFTKTFPRWLTQFNEKNPIEKQFNYTWTPLDAALLAEVTKIPDAAPGEGNTEKITNKFPHAIANADPANTLRATPLGTDLVFDTAKAAVVGMKLGQKSKTDLLALTISSHDYAGHYWGQESWERLDLMLRLDKSLGAFLAYLDDNVGKGKYAVVFTSDHGAMPMVEQSRALGHTAIRLTGKSVLKAAKDTAESELGRGLWVQSVAANGVYMSEQFNALPEGKREAVLDKIAEAVSRVEGIGYTAPRDKILGECDNREGIEALACRTVHPTRSGEIFSAPGRWSIVTSKYKTGTSHGTPNPEDRLVPILVSVPDAEPRIVDAPVSMLRVAPTVAKLLGIKVPSTAKAPPL